MAKTNTDEGDRKMAHHLNEKELIGIMMDEKNANIAARQIASDATSKIHRIKALDTLIASRVNNVRRDLDEIERAINEEGIPGYACGAKNAASCAADLVEALAERAALLESLNSLNTVLGTMGHTPTDSE